MVVLCGAASFDRQNHCVHDVRANPSDAPVKKNCVHDDQNRNTQSISEQFIYIEHFSMRLREES